MEKRASALVAVDGIDAGILGRVGVWLVPAMAGAAGISAGGGIGAVALVVMSGM